ncbi:phosphotransferase family protein [Streptomyces sp. NPDC056165]|uniref:phosphotransferase family protein n=1 Tax=Streptomyces sp. NPDC056165 TaxID=3345733 RepID=UPI0035E143D7
MTDTATGPGTDPGPTTERDEIEARLSALWGAPVTATVPSAMPGGASRQTTRFTAHCADRTRDLVLRRDPAGPAGAAAMALEAAVMTTAAAAGVPVPELVDSGDSLGGNPYLVMGHVDGEVIPRRLLRGDAFAAVRPDLAAQFGEVAARIHTMGPDAVPGLVRQDPIEALRALAERWDSPRPSVEMGIRWLEEHRVAPSGDTVVHGDLRNGNVIVGPEGIRAVLDWELVHRGDPVEDLGWLCVKAWRFGALPPVGGFGSRSQLLDAYAKVAGSRPTDEQLHWWEVYASLRWVLICRQQAAVHLEGPGDSLEHAVIGRRVCEAEFDLLLALGLTAPETVADPLATVDAAAPDTLARGAVPHDAPDADHLLAVVERALADGELGGAVPAGRARFLTKVAANALRIARREALLAADLTAAHRARLEALGLTTDVEFADAIRSGRAAADAPETVHAVVAAVRDKLLVANPRYLGQPAAPAIG